MRSINNTNWKHDFFISDENNIQFWLVNTIMTGEADRFFVVGIQSNVVQSRLEGWDWRWRRRLREQENSTSTKRDDSETRKISKRNILLAIYYS